MRLKIEYDEECASCKHGHFYGAHLTTDPFYSKPSSAECTYDFDCPYLYECDGPSEDVCMGCAADCDARFEDEFIVSQGVDEKIDKNNFTGGTICGSVQQSSIYSCGR